MPYKLSAALKAHTADVRALTSPSNELVLSASRDSTAIAWERSDTSFSPEAVLKAGTRFVNSVTYLPPDDHSLKGYAVTGGQDAVINIFNLDKPKDEPDFILVGHSENVCALYASADGTIISGSWDRTAKVWKKYSLLYDLKGHGQSVWAVLAVDENQFLTGSADKTIKLWQNNKEVHTFTGHQDAVRGLALLPDIGFASCSNDSEIRVWTLGGDAVYTLSGHTSFVYSVSVLPSGDVVSAGEDRTVRVWKDGECDQTIVHPAISVWAVSTMPNGDIVSGCSDGVVRVFSASEERWASSEALNDYDAQIANQALPSQQIGDVKKSDLPGLEALDAPGKKAGEVKMVKNMEVVEAHQWDTATSSWQKIGEVVDAVGQTRKQLYNGKEYDYVFDVDIKDGEPPLKLPYNASENPYSAAQRFLQSNELPQTYIDEVVRFIEQNTTGVSLGGGGGEEYVDPYTGASRYRGTPTAPTQGAQSYGDPFTGGSGYRPSGASPATVPAPTPKAAPTLPAGSKVLPVPKPITFKQANVVAMRGKLIQFNDALQAEISTSSLALYPAELKLLDEVFAYLGAVTASPPQTPSTSISIKSIESIISVLERWPAAQRFPVIDLTRLIVGFSPDALKQDGTLRQKLVETLFKACEWNATWTLSKAQETNILLLLRTVANALDDGVRIDQPWIATLLATLKQAPYNALNKAQRVALATVLFNVSCTSLKVNLDNGIKDTLALLLQAILENETADPETVYRAQVALGNLLYSANGSVKLPRLGQVLSQTANRFNDARMKNISQEIVGLL